MLIDLDAEREIYVVFQGESNYFGSCLFKDGFKHVFCIERQALGWICFDPSRSDMIATILPASYPTDIIPRFRANNPGASVVKLMVKPTDKHSYPRPGIISCVSAVQYYLGVYWPCVFTPYQLYRKLSTVDYDHIRMQDLWVTTVRDMLPRMPQSKQKEPHDS